MPANHIGTASTHASSAAVHVIRLGSAAAAARTCTAASYRTRRIDHHGSANGKRRGNQLAGTIRFSRARREPDAADLASAAVECRLAVRESRRARHVPDRSAHNGQQGPSAAGPTVARWSDWPQVAQVASLPTDPI